MAKRSRTTPQSPSVRPELVQALGEGQELISQQIAKGNEVLAGEIASREELASAGRAFRNWEDYTKELLRRLFTTDELAEEFGAPIRMFYSLGPSTINEDIAEFLSDGRTRLRRLESIGERLPLFAPQQASSQRAGALGNRVFIVHGRDHGPRDAIRNFLRDIEVDSVVLEDQPNQGRTIIEKFEAHVDVAFAVVILTPDDVGAARDETDKARPRARQNVTLELGFFIGLLGRGRVAPIKVGDVEVPSDVDGIVYIDFDQGGAWKLRLGKELKAAGIAVDLNRAV